MFQTQSLFKTCTLVSPNNCSVILYPVPFQDYFYSHVENSYQFLYVVFYEVIMCLQKAQKLKNTSED
jgi:hypothetical protein